MTDSSTGGFLVPTEPNLPGGLTLVQFIQQSFVGMTGFDGADVRPKWQKNPPKQKPNPEDNYMTFGITTQSPNDMGYLKVAQDGESSDLSRYELLTVLCSFYGSDCQKNAGILRDSFQIKQNRDYLSTGNIKFKEAFDTTFIPELHGQAWFPRCDLTIILNRRIEKNYSILSMVSSSGDIEGQKSNDELENVSFNVEE